MAEHSIVQFSTDHSGHSCGYCDSSSSSYSHGLSWVPICCCSRFHASWLICCLLGY